MITYTYEVEQAGHDKLTGDPFWAVVEYRDLVATGADAHWVRERYAHRAAELYRRDPSLHGKPSSVLRERGMVFDTDVEYERNAYYKTSVDFTRHGSVVWEPSTGWTDAQEHTP